MRFPIAPFLLLTLVCIPVSAGQITMKNGDRLTGKIVKSDGKKLTFASDLAGTVEVPYDQIQSVASDEKLYVVTSDDRTVSGTVSTTGDSLSINGSEAGPVDVSLADVSAIRSESEQAAWERLQHPGLTELWRGAFDTGIAVAAGNSETTTYTLGFAADRTTLRDKLSVYSAILYSTNSTTGESVTTANNIRGGGRYEININKRLFGYVAGSLEHDELADLDLRMIAGGGLGYHAIANERTALDLFAGGNVNREWFNIAPDRTTGELQFGNELTHKLTSKTLLKQRFVIFPNLNDAGEYRFQFDGAAITTINKWLGFQVSLSDRYLSNPPDGVKTNDLVITAGLRFAFGK